jgi:hypothetical protein
LRANWRERSMKTACERSSMLSEMIRLRTSAQSLSGSAWEEWGLSWTQGKVQSVAGRCHQLTMLLTVCSLKSVTSIVLACITIICVCSFISVTSPLHQNVGSLMTGSPLCWLLYLQCINSAHHITVTLEATLWTND